MLELYYQYRRVIARFRGGALGNEIDRGVWRKPNSLSIVNAIRDMVKVLGKAGKLYDHRPVH